MIYAAKLLSEIEIYGFFSQHSLTLADYNRWQAKLETRRSSVRHWWKQITTGLVNILRQSGQLRQTLTVSCRAVIGWWMEAAVVIQ